MADHDKGQATAVTQVFEQVEHLGLHRGVQRRGGFIQQQNLRLQNQGPCNRNALALAARQLVGVTEPKTSAQAHLVKRPLNAGLGIVHLVDGQRFGQDAVHRLARVQRAIRVLKHHLHQAAKRFAAGLGQRRRSTRTVTRTGSFAQQLHAASGQWREATDGAQHGRFSRARLTHQTKATTGLDLERGVGHRDKAVVGDPQALHGQANRAAHSAHSGCRSRVGKGCRASPSLGRQLSRPSV